MHANDKWIALFHRIPGNLHDTLSVGLTTGAEIVIQRIVKLEPEFMITRARLAGTTDPGRIMLVPYAQLTYISILRLLSEAEIESIFGKGDLPPVPDIPIAAPAPATSAPEPATVNDAIPGVNPLKKKDAPSKTVLLAKLRDRLKDSPLKK